MKTIIQDFCFDCHFQYRPTITNTGLLPDEDKTMVVYASTQFPENTHSVITRCLGVLGHNIHVITRRVGGVFSGKKMNLEMEIDEQTLDDISVFVVFDVYGSGKFIKNVQKESNLLSMNSSSQLA
ncbi:hypothetical protein H5410_057683 [Solanum commersonii]|uniref:Aldehyde oxidase/xanthine dehydrogenase first molybdopterin binding domain-containing protein n=1 Tax=Solanum commersonii TaxID=4109 RepID=A0A9J5WQF5_SOLCO|nr:hypothetical protein H5410_057683 [Solanum commersonii]